MTRMTFIAAALALAVTLPAQATGAARTFLSAAGSDANSCTNVATPCRHFAAAYAATAPNGEIFVLDPANYGSLTITHAVSIQGHGWASIAPVVDGNAITINANPGDKINIVGVVLDGTGVAGTNGIVFNSGGSLTVRDSAIRNFTATGIVFTPISSTLSQIFVSNTAVSDNGNQGFIINPNGTGTTTGVLNHVEIQNNQLDGLLIDTSSQTINITVSDSVSAGNGANGIFIQSTATERISVMVRNSTLANNSTSGLLAVGSPIAARITRSTITGNGGTAWGSNFAVVSYADNNIDGNDGEVAAGNTAPSAIVYK